MTSFTDRYQDILTFRFGEGKGNEPLQEGRMAWGMVNVAEQRIAFVVRANRRKKSMKELCKETLRFRGPPGTRGCGAFESGGIEAVVEKSRCPHHSLVRTAKDIEQRVVEPRQRRPDWGARKIHPLLKKDGLTLPIITIHRILVRHDLVRPQDRHRTAVQRFSRSAPNQLWQMDFKGPVGWQAPVGPLSI